MSDSPVKKLDFAAAGKENAPVDTDASVSTEIETKKPFVEGIKTEQAVVVAPTIKPEEADEPLLQENPQRFVLFPIKYHEVSRVTNASRVQYLTLGSNTAITDLADVQEG